MQSINSTYFPPTMGKAALREEEKEKKEKEEILFEERVSSLA
ncbi:hypothetical protein T4B_1079 [Trichinella pseudospiralis]|uniref:Uncharacterized protein n=2 Tax=Trichinella pseudospiralis TaxID=6337 RepID=A0A0V1G4G5_TRIPS|nr:hypothetical protein T4E_6962 [Trichinella pseudospiralis]KRY76973.1 hypothetical protein T4A_777 [Trichinella pseudospiralis]KRY93192.1 hypothetical protein T4D_3948 [Trichinella pseudospiralis]KRZ34473.1 hypothetical protein T4B_1079 [Trichinella pseudospiralis]KRZ45495.1 hypothetical protein T4C_13164 [Trichinella pseudospiralis]